MTTQYDGKYTVIGPPGTGKTTFLADRTERALQRGERVLLASLTRTAAAAIRERRIPVDPESVGTLHSHAYRAIGRPPVVARKHLDEWNDEHPEWSIRSIEEDDFGAQSTAGEQLYRATELYRHRCVEPPGHLRPFYDAWQAFLEDGGIVDYTGMIESALRDVDTAPGAPDVIMADEAQDLSRLEWQLLSRWSDRAQGFIAVGDPWQALYVWRGADPEVFFSDDVPENHRGVLKQSYRVPRAVHEYAMKWPKGMSDYRPVEYRPRDADGEVLHSAAKWHSPDNIVREAIDHAEAGRRVLIQAYSDYMLKPTLKALRDRRVPFANPFRTNRADWNPLRKLRRATAAVDRALSLLRVTRHGEFDWSTGREETERWTYADLDRFVQPLVTKGNLHRGAKESVKKLASARPHDEIDYTDLVAVFTPPFDVLADGLDGKAQVEALVAWYGERMLTTQTATLRWLLDVAASRGVDALDEDPGIMVGTIHSFKGAEASVVYLFPELPWAAYRAWTAGDDESRDAIRRAFYVASTRAKDTLVLCARADRNAVQL